MRMIIDQVGGGEEIGKEGRRDVHHLIGQSHHCLDDRSDQHPGGMDYIVMGFERWNKTNQRQLQVE